MMNASQYGNAGAYFSSALPATRAMLGLSAAGKSRVSVYSIIKQGGVNISTQARAAASSVAIVGWLGLRPVAFPLTSGWNFDGEPT